MTVSISFITNVMRNKALFIVLSLGFVLIVINLALVKQNRELRSLLAKRPGRSKALENGKTLPPLDGMDLDGRDFVLDYGADRRRALLFIFTPGCEACEQNVDHWKSILKKADGEAFRFIAISTVLDSSITKEFIRRHDLLDLPVIAVTDRASREEYNLSMTPQTILVSSEGRIERVWPGSLEEGKQADLEQYLDLKPLARE
jgi:peroxiredoxin